MKNKELLILSLLTLLYFPTLLFADTITLKSGQKIEGKIIAKSTNSIMIQSNSGQCTTYPPKDIKEIIEGDTTSPQNQVNDKLVENYNKTIVKEGPSKNVPPEAASISESSAVEWKSDLTNVSVPDINAQGMIHGQTFQCEKAILEGNILKLRQGNDFFADLELDIFLFPKKDETIENNTFKVTREEGIGSPHVHMEWKPKDADIPKTEIFMKDYAMYLAFGAKTDGKLPGKIYICLPDEDKSVVAGTFETNLPTHQETRPQEKNNPATTALKTKLTIQKPSLLPILGAAGLIFGAFFGIAILLIFVVYIYSSICLYRIAKKTNQENAWLAWIPIVNLFLMCKISGLKYLWLLIFFVGLIPIIGRTIGPICSTALFTYIWYRIAAALKKPGWLGILIIIPLVNLVIMGYLAFSKD